jgi:hypothetical protein
MAHFPNKDLNLQPDDGGNRYRQNILTYPSNYTASNPEDCNFDTPPIRTPRHIFFALLLHYHKKSTFSVAYLIFNKG